MDGRGARHPIDNGNVVGNEDAEEGFGFHHDAGFGLEGGEQGFNCVENVVNKELRAVGANIE